MALSSYLISKDFVVLDSNIQLESGDESISLNEAGAYAIVPQNVWHTAKTSVKTKVLFITPGEGTQNKSV